ncbi:MAG: VOC family protein [Pseudonocardiales bacterium]
MQIKLELVPIPVADVDRAKAFYRDRVGFVEDLDVRPAEGVRIVQLTPPGSACSIAFGTGLTAFTEMKPGDVKGIHLVVADIAAARADLAGRGVQISDIDEPGGAGVKYAAFTDPDGNSMVLQEMSWRTGENF